ncbi:helix-turn-helix transcriptional regulator [Telmatospirillum sp.]|uniref:helix-turn-helix domain-containing protein n=1 Tax=Telmatospirillum sp. TaxID=2079197 RepID=UPI00283D72E8|nr:helix-turn-helix transcriptional regulator [Telmatospirillum sp.]MDR3436481.1 helix-turn-helix transcriptional regulator [Telmatospirillum sp.]
MSNISAKEEILTRIRAGETICQIADSRGCSYEYVYGIVKGAGLPVPKRRRGTTPDIEAQAVDALHAQIGRDMFDRRNKYDCVPYAEFARQIGMSMTNLIRAESGCHKFTLWELQRIAKVLDVTVAELTTERNVKFSPLEGK